MLPKLPPSTVSFPNRDYWLAPERRAGTWRRLGAHLLIMGGARELLGRGTLFANMDLLFGPIGANWQLTLPGDPGGLLIATMGTQSSPGGVEDDWLGAPMYWSSYDSRTNVRLVREAGLAIVQAREERVEEHGEEVAFLWIVARK